MKKYRFSDLMNYDNELFLLANYEAAKGLIPILETPEQVNKYRAKVAKIFNRYKVSIQSGECDLKFIRDSVMSKYGAIPPLDMTEEEMIEHVIEGNDLNRIEPEDFKDTLLGILEDLKRRGDTSSNTGLSNLDPNTDRDNPPNYEDEDDDIMGEFQ
jgi:hypothetical protein